MLAVHETAEEEIVHPAARRALPDGEAIVKARLQEENEAKKALAELERLDCSSYAGVESAAGNLIAGPFVSMVDRVRDALTGKNVT